MNSVNTAEIRDKLLDKYYNGRDSSHDKYHAIKVRKNTIFIYENLSYYEKKKFQPAIKLLNENNIDVELFLSLCAELHDVIDHKYIKNTKKTEDEISIILKEKLLIPCEFSKIIWEICNNVSFSKQLAGKRDDLGNWNPVLYLISDADRIEALGRVSFDRMIVYTYSVLHIKTPEKIFGNIYNHTQKLLKMYPTKTRNSWKYIKFGISREVSFSLHEDLRVLISDKCRALSIISEKIKSIQNTSKSI